MKFLACFTVMIGAASAFSACGGNVVVDVGGTTTDSGTTSTLTTGTLTTTTGTTTTGMTTTGTTTTGTTTTGTTTTGTTTSPACGDLEVFSEPRVSGVRQSELLWRVLACATGTACDALIACQSFCDTFDEPCFDKCSMNGTAPGFNELQAVVQCVDSSCAQIPNCATTEVCQTGFDAPTPACGACLSAGCCGQFQACMNDLGAPGSQPCGDCILGVAANPAACDTDPLYNAAITCESNVCVNECATGICDTGLTTANPPCDACLSNACCAPLQACVNDTSSPSCLDACLLSGSPDADCDDASTPLGALFLGITSCWNNACTGPSTCGGGI